MRGDGNRRDRGRRKARPASKAVVAAALALAACGPGADESAGAALVQLLPVQETPEGTLVRSERWPPATVRVDPAFRHLGTRAVSLGAGKAEIHVLADTADTAVRRLYWIQFEGQPPGRRYDYSDLPFRDTIDGYLFSTDVRHGAYTAAEVADEPDTRAVGEVLAAAGLDFPAPMMRARMVALDETARNELLVIYMEALSWSGLSEAELAADETAWARAAAALRERAAGGLGLVEE